MKAQTRQDLRDVAAAALSGMLIFGSLVGLTLWLSAKSCEAHWARSGLRAELVSGSGCQVEVARGRWLPEKSVRETDLESPPK
jgi:hypothetical protein